MSKRQKCVGIFMENPGASRGELIEMFIEEAGCSRAGASTYASEIMKENRNTAAKILKVSNETDEEIEDRLDERFRVIDMLSAAACDSSIRALIISGPAGLGKSYTVEEAMNAYDPNGEKTVHVKGFVRATGLFRLLHSFRHPGNVIVMDDADSIFGDTDALNLLKAACDTTRDRKIYWGAETKMTDADGELLPTQFEFNGTVIFITNVDFDNEIAKSGKFAPHFEALVSRSHYVSCDMHSQRDYVVRIKQVIAKGMLRTQRGLDAEGETAISSFIEENADKLRELTLRIALKIADNYKLDRENWEMLTRVSCFKQGV